MISQEPCTAATDRAQELFTEYMAGMSVFAGRISALDTLEKHFAKGIASQEDYAARQSCGIRFSLNEVGLQASCEATHCPLFPDTNNA